MQKWEYLQVNVSNWEWVASAGRSGRLPKMEWPEQPRSTEPDTTGLLNELGENGWELTGVASDSHLNYILFLKRPRE